ncbi:MAG: hypothetical protein AB1635_05780 [Acidobacteriota bacterium]
MRSPLPSPDGPLAPPPRAAFTRAELRLVDRLRTPAAVQRWLNELPYNTEQGGATLRSFRGVVASGRAHCLEAALSAAVLLEQHGYPPIVMSLESQDRLDHVVFVYKAAGGWGSVARSRDPGLHGRRPVFRSLRDLAWSYVEPYVDDTGRVQGYGAANLAEALPRYDWRLSPRNVWRVERLLIDWPHRRLRMSDERYRRLHARYVAYRQAHGGRKPVYYDRTAWTPIPAEFSRGRSRGAAS